VTWVPRGGRSVGVPKQSQLDGGIAHQGESQEEAGGSQDQREGGGQSQLRSVGEAEYRERQTPPVAHRVLRGRASTACMLI